MRQDPQGRLLVLLILCALVGAWRYNLAQPINDAELITNIVNTGTLRVRGTVSNEPKLQGHSRLFMVTVNGTNLTNGYQWNDAHGQLEVRTPGTTLTDPYAPGYGDNVEIQGKLLIPDSYSPPATSASMVFPQITVTGSGGDPVLVSLYNLRTSLATTIAQNLPQPDAALLTAILLGLRTPALKPLTAAFSVTGTAHLIVPSGFKVTILSGLVAGSMRWLNKRSDRLLLPAEKRRDWRRWLSTCLQILCICSYTILSGTGSAALRSGIMGILLVTAPRLGRNYNVYTALALAALLMSLADPFVLWDTGFLLSFLGTLGIVLLTPFIQQLLHPLTHIPWFGHIVAENISVTLAAQIATLPIFALVFQQVSFISPIANLLTVPLLGILILLGLFICLSAAVFAPLATLSGWVVWPILWYMRTVVTWCANLPGAYLTYTMDNRLAWAYYLLLGGVVFLLLRQQQLTSAEIAPVKRKQQKEQQLHTIQRSLNLSRNTWRFLQICAAMLVILTTGIVVRAGTANGLLTLTFLDVGPANKMPQGEAILLHTPDGRTALIDGGSDATSLGQALTQQLPPWQHTLDVVILTSPRADHITGLQDIVTRYSIGQVLDAGMLHPSTTYARWRRTISERNILYRSVAQGTSISIGTQCLLQVLWPTAILHKGSNEIRDNGLIISLTAPGLHALLLGASAQSSYALNALSQAFVSNPLQVEIVQMIGEGSQPASPALLKVLQMVHPALLVITPAAVAATRSKTHQATTDPIKAAGDTSEPITKTTSAWQVVQTAQTGSLEITSGTAGWSMSTL